MLEIKKRNQAYEKTQKGKLVTMASNNDIPYGDIISYVKEQDTLSRRKANFDHKIVCFKSDGVYQLNRAINEIVGVAKTASDDNPSAKEVAIDTVDVQLADGTRLKVPYGRIDLPDAGEDAHIEIGYNSKTSELLITGTSQMRFSSLIDDIVLRTEELLNTDSIYKNQAFELDSNMQPKILPLHDLDKEFMLLSAKVEKQLRPLYSRIREPQKCLDNKVPLKVGALLSGPYGTGKTLVAFKMAQEAIKNNWVFIYLKDPTLLAKTLKMSKTLDNNGWGVILFLEDIDQVTSGERDAKMQDILNTLDGGDTKGMNVISIFTTNHIEKIEPTLLRGKRIGNLVEMEAWDADTTYAYLLHVFEKEYNLEKEGLEDVCKFIEQNKIVPAFMAEITEKVKANLIFNDDDKITALDIRTSVESYLAQVALARPKKTDKTTAEKFAETFTEVMFETGKGKELTEKVQNIYDNLN